MWTVNAKKENVSAIQVMSDKERKELVNQVSKKNKVKKDPAESDWLRAWLCMKRSSSKCLLANRDNFSHMNRTLLNTYTAI